MSATVEALSLSEKRETLQALRAKARLKLLPFILHTKPNYKAGWFHYTLASRLDQFLQDVIDLKSPRMIIMAPPRHGKSEIVSRRFPAFALGRYPDLRFIATSYSNDLASDMNRDVQKIIDSEEYAELFPGTKLSGSAVRTVTAKGSYLRNSEVFEIVDHIGRYKSAGVGTGITGQGGEILLIDDPVKNDEEAQSPTVRESIWNWYETTLKTRAEPGGGILLIMTRWHEDDLAGRLLEAMANGGEQWEIVRFPAIAEEEEVYRHVGDALHPERYPVEALNRIRFGGGTLRETGTGSRVWISLYQQRPSAIAGSYFKREDWQHYDLVPQGLLIEGGTERDRLLTFLGVERVIQYWDTAFGGKQDDDFSACITLGICKARFCVLDYWKEKVESPELLKQIKLEFDKWRPSQVGVEGGGSASGKMSIQMLSRETTIAFTEVIHSTDKPLRAKCLSPTHEAKLVWLPKGADWVRDFVEACSNFPNIKKDDDVDAFMGSIELAQQGIPPMVINEDVLAQIGA